jgi:plasmid stabilization system protein ParE
MSAEYKVHWARIAESDFREIILYIAEDSPTNAIEDILLKRLIK